MSMECYAAKVEIETENGKVFNYFYPYDNEICPDLRIPNNWEDECTTVDDILDLIDNAFQNEGDSLSETIESFDEYYPEEAKFMPDYQEFRNDVKSCVAEGDAISHISFIVDNASGITVSTEDLYMNISGVSSGRSASFTYDEQDVVDLGEAFAADFDPEEYENYEDAEEENYFEIESEVINAAETSLNDAVEIIKSHQYSLSEEEIQQLLSAISVKSNDLFEEITYFVPFDTIKNMKAFCSEGIGRKIDSDTWSYFIKHSVDPIYPAETNNYSEFVSAFYKQLKTKKEKTEQDYKNALIQYSDAKTKEEYEIARSYFALLDNYKDSGAKKRECEIKIQELEDEEREKEEKEIREIENEKSKQEKATDKKRGITTLIILAVIAILIVAFALFNKLVMVPAQNYKYAVELVNQGEYEEAIKTLEDSGQSDKKNEIYELSIEHTLKTGEIMDVIFIYGIPQEFYDSHPEEMYKLAKHLADDQCWGVASNVFEGIRGYKDAQKYRTYCDGMFSMDMEEYDDAMVQFQEIKDFLDAKEKWLEAFNKQRYSVDDAISLITNIFGTDSKMNDLLERCKTVREYKGLWVPYKTENRYSNNVEKYNGSKKIKVDFYVEKETLYGSFTDEYHVNRGKVQTGKDGYDYFVDASPYDEIAYYYLSPDELKIDWDRQDDIYYATKDE